MSFEYIAQAYGKTFKKNQIVRVSTDNGKTSKLGVVVKATHHVYVRGDGEKHALPYHPNDVEPATKAGDETWLDESQKLLKTDPGSGR